MMKRVLLALVRFYRVAISPYRPPCCRYTPTFGGHRKIRRPEGRLDGLS